MLDIIIKAYVIGTSKLPGRLRDGRFTTYGMDYQQAAQALRDELADVGPVAQRRLVGVEQRREAVAHGQRRDAPAASCHHQLVTSGRPAELRGPEEVVLDPVDAASAGAIVNNASVVGWRAQAGWCCACRPVSRTR